MMVWSLTSGYGILDIELKLNNISYACGGSGIHFKSEDGGLIWKREKFVFYMLLQWFKRSEPFRNKEMIPGNLYSIKFITINLVFLPGSVATLLKLKNKNI